MQMKNNSTINSIFGVTGAARRRTGISLMMALMILITQATLMTLTIGCSDDQAVIPRDGGDGISFRLQGNTPATRATGTTTGNVNAFVVNAQDQRDVVIFDAQTVYRVEGIANKFDYKPKEYYPDESVNARFSAYSPVTKNVTVGFKSSTANMIAYTVPAPDGAYGNTAQEDLLVAYTFVTGAEQGVGKTVDRKGFNEAVPLNFKHALSRVYVKASNANEEAVIIKSISLNSLCGSGTLDVDGTAWNGADVDINEGYKSSITNLNDYKVLWNVAGPPNASYSYVLPAVGITVPARTVEPQMVVSAEQGMLILPQTTQNIGNDTKLDEENDVKDFYLSVTYKLSNIEKTVRAVFNDLALKTEGDFADKGITFEFGKQYVLNIVFAGTMVNFSLTVEEWDVAPTVQVEAVSDVVFAINRPAGASHEPECVICTDTFVSFHYGQKLPDMPSAPSPAVPTLTGWVFDGFWDAPVGGTRFYEWDDNAGWLTNGSLTWNKTGPYQILYAHWIPTSSKGAWAGTKTGVPIFVDNGEILKGVPLAWEPFYIVDSIEWVFDQPLPDLKALPEHDSIRDFRGLFLTEGVRYFGFGPYQPYIQQIYDAQGKTTAIYNKVNQYETHFRGGDPSNDPYNIALAGLVAKWTFTVTIDLMGGRYDGSSVNPTFEQVEYSPINFTMDPDKFTYGNLKLEKLIVYDDYGSLDVWSKTINGGNWNWSGQWVQVSFFGNAITIYAIWE
jgi:hypothetical protein